MNMIRALTTTTCTAFVIFSASVPADVVTDWNQTAVKATEVAGLPPPPQSRALAIVHAAIYDAVNSIERRHTVYAIDVKAPTGASIEASVAAAGHGILTRLFPGQQATHDAALSTSLAPIAEGDAKNQGLEVGREVAAKLFELRKTDGAAGKSEYSFGTGPGVYQKTPPMNANPVLPHWRHIKPFVLASASQFTPPGPPAPGSAAFAKDFNEVKKLGARNSRLRTSEQTAIALFWAGSEIPPLNTVARVISSSKNLGVVENARLFAYLNMAIADSLIAGFEAKYKFNAWRPITAIRGATSTGNRALLADANWEPLMVTPPHPEYPSAHCLATGAAAEVLVGFLGTDKVQVGLVQPPLGFHRVYQSIPEIVKEMEDARVWGGIHFRSADVDGTRLGRQVGGYALLNSLQPVSNSAAR
jgi:hypothetical protein